MDVTIVFLYDNLSKVIYIEQPPVVYTIWYDRFTHYLIILGYTKGNANSNIYIKQGDHSIFLIIVLYVDDLLLISNKLILLNQANPILCQ
jgi:hypothetical protein